MHCHPVVGYLDNNNRACGRQGPLSWLDEIGFRGPHTKEVGNVGRREVIHFIVQNNACACDQR